MKFAQRCFVPFTIVLALTSGCGGNDGKAITESGTLEATEVTISAQVGGPILRLRVDEGTAVQTGDTLLVIDATDVTLQQKQAEAGLAMVEAQFRLAVEGVRKEDFIQAEANFKNATDDLKRMEDLFSSSSVSQKQLDDTRTRFTLAQQTYEKAKKGSREEEIQLAKARRDQAAAQLASLRKKVNDCTVISPTKGTVTKRYIERGELVGPGMALFKVADLQEMDLTVYLTETDLPKIRVGESAKIRVDAFPKRDFEGSVVFISPTAEFTPKNIQTRDERTKLVFGVKLKVSNTDEMLKAGIPADVTFTVKE
jgi:HlyD family secretion protein